ncbi:PREDICTED: protein ERGIC-53-like [Nanorana parkeri]|uniref:protein ERGIC-53-like n=1 Tax=Nanorana parkeri TaxID=125878 RepID=UPI0008542866|nr:PREDICTED: protein ERGIC-53-like [Nanorana parkeri]
MSAGILPKVIQHIEEVPAHRTFEYKYSFKGPHITLPDGTLPFWEKLGDAIAGPDEIRLVPSIKNHKGSVWTRSTSNFTNWEMEVSIRISGHGPNGAEGMALWYTRKPGDLGPVYGSSDHWDGLGIIFDTFDHDFKGNNPAIVIVGNNGKLQYDHLRDGSSQALGTCVTSFRNTIRPFRAKITYYKKTLQISVYTGLSPNNRAYEVCAVVHNVVLPSTGYFGVSAATSALADDHDIMSFMVYSLSTSWEEPGSQIPEEERERFEKEFEEFQKELEKNKDEFHKNFPIPDENAFESDSQRELDMILHGQARLMEELRVLKTRLNMTLEEQFRHRSILINSKANETTTVSTEHLHSSIETVMNGMPDLLTMTKDLKSEFHKVATKVKDLPSSKEAASPSSNPTSAKEVKEDFIKIKKSLEGLVKSSEQTSRCPPRTTQTSCLSSGIFLTFLLLQSICTVAYILLRRSQKDSGSKKLY